MRRILILAAAAAALALAAFAGGAQGADDRSAAAAGTEDTIPPDPYIRARKRQDKNTALKKGIQTTCGTEDDERPVTCTMSASLGGKLVARETDEIVAPFNRVQFHLQLDKKVKHEIRSTEKSVTIKLFLEVEDEAGNVGTAKRNTKLVKDLFG
ncbi:MAG: hypothetical protein QOE75_1495 [Solirubrobacterales bacterium]|nr:hypothetical protein [Solirubrobacterales bacterium]